MRSRPIFVDLLFFVISAQFGDESRETQKTKVVRKRSKINPEVESRRTDHYGARKVAEKQTAEQKFR